MDNNPKTTSYIVAGIGVAVTALVGVSFPLNGVQVLWVLVWLMWFSASWIP